MKRIVMVLGAMMLILSISGVAGAAMYEFIPSDPDLGDLEHSHAYAWGIEFNFQSEITSAALTFTNIRNWDNNPNDLWVHLLDDPALGVNSYTDSGSAFDDYFDGQGILLNHWQNLSSNAQNIIYSFDADEIASLMSYSEFGTAGFGFDPDCHFYNDGIKLNIETAPVPEPATLFLLGTGLAGLVGLKRRKK